MLAAQLLVIAISTAVQHRNNLTGWLWHLDREANIPSTLASTQLALIGAVALLTAWLSKARTIWQRLYYAGFGVIFIHLARDEFFLFHEGGLRWQVPFALFGAGIALATALSIYRLPPSLRIWHATILAGLAMGGTGALALDVFQFSEQCSATLFFTGRCEIYVLEETLEFLGMWLALVGALGLFSAAAPISSCWRLIYLIPALWIITHHIPYLITLTEYLSRPASSSVALADDDVRLQIYRLEREDASVSLQFFALPRSWHHYTGVGYSLHLVDQVSGISYAGVDASGRRNHRLPYWIAKREYIYKQWLDIEFPLTAPPPPRNRALWLVLTTWRKQNGEFPSLEIEHSDYPLLGGNQVIVGELVLEAAGGPQQDNPVAFFEPGIVLERAEFPQRGRAGESLPFGFEWRSAEAVEQDLVQFLHLGHEASGEWLVFDQPPLGARLPSRLWYQGLADGEDWQAPLPADMAPGPYAVYTGLYRVSDRERLRAGAADGTPYTDNRVPLGSLTIGESDW